jgi:CO/xanthine dehydrogenase Mo-binding subunit
MPEESVRVIYAEGSGSYGHNGADDAAADAVLISHKLGRPVRVQWSRSDEFIWEPYTPAMLMDMRGGLSPQGRIIAWQHDVWSPTHGNRPRMASQLLAGQLAYGLRPPQPEWFGGGDRNAPVDYALPNQRVVAHWLTEMPLRTSAMRTLGGAANTFANESFMDELADLAGTDPLTFRLNHLDDERGIAALQAAADRAGWGQPLPDGTGRGLAYARYENDGAYVATVAQVRVDPERGAVHVERLISAHDCGLIVNPDGVTNQIEGNLIQSLSRALFEEITFDETHITSSDWDTYPILRFSDLPKVEVVLLNQPDEPLVGAGEPASICTAPAVANAIFDACGARLRQIPFTADKIRGSL